MVSFSKFCQRSDFVKLMIMMIIQSLIFVIPQALLYTYENEVIRFPLLIELEKSSFPYKKNMKWFFFFFFFIVLCFFKKIVISTLNNKGGEKKKKKHKMTLLLWGWYWWSGIRKIIVILQQQPVGFWTICKCLLISFIIQLCYILCW